MAQVLSPESLAPGRGYSNGILYPPGQTLFIAGQIGWDRDCKLVSDSFADQFEQALANVMAVVAEAGGDATHIGRMTFYVTDKQAYLAALKAIGGSFRKHMGRHYPAMTLVEVQDLLEEGAQVEIEATAILPFRDDASA